MIDELSAQKTVYVRPVSELIREEAEAILCVSVTGTDPYGPGPVYNDFV